MRAAARTGCQTLSSQQDAGQVGAAWWSVQQRIRLGRLREGRVEGERECREAPIRSVQVESEMLNAETAG